MAVSYEILFTRTAYSHLEALRRYDRNTILDAIREQLPHRPEEETRNRKQLRENPLADWELRVGPHRVFYEVDTDNRKVRIIAIGLKDGGKLIIGGQEVAL
jgi:mRNA-degrading endonuclease RelE of RelBE toxin-antitoxin system